MKATFIDISEIFRQQHRIMKAESGNWFLFYIGPFFSGILFSILFYKDSEKVLNILTLFLSIFIPIFLSLLATMISFVMNKIRTRHNKERISLLKETFYNICYLIPTSLSLLLLSLFMQLTYGKTTDFIWRTEYWNICVTYHRLAYTLLGTLFYGGIIHVILNLMMITKRIFKLFDKEIDLLTVGLEDSSTKDEALKDANALQGEE